MSLSMIRYMHKILGSTNTSYRRQKSLLLSEFTRANHRQISYRTAAIYQDIRNSCAEFSFRSHSTSCPARDNLSNISFSGSFHSCSSLSLSYYSNVASLSLPSWYGSHTTLWWNASKKTSVDMASRQNSKYCWSTLKIKVCFGFRTEQNESARW